MTDEKKLKALSKLAMRTDNERGESGPVYLRDEEGNDFEDYYVVFREASGTQMAKLSTSGMRDLVRYDPDSGQELVEREFDPTEKITTLIDMGLIVDAVLPRLQRNDEGELQVVSEKWPKQRHEQKKLISDFPAELHIQILSLALEFYMGEGESEVVEEAKNLPKKSGGG